jgi:putative ABC transport system permease protein
MIWIVIAFVIATPVAWKVIGDWLAKFEYRIDLSWWIFAVVGLIAMMVAFVTISIQAYKVAVRNPVEALRYE